MVRGANRSHASEALSLRREVAVLVDRSHDAIHVCARAGDAFIDQSQGRRDARRGC
jgi:hypothetical protein